MWQSHVAFLVLSQNFLNTRNKVAFSQSHRLSFSIFFLNPYNKRTHVKQRKQKQSRRLLFRLFLLICIVVGLLIALYPFYVDSLNSLMDQKRMEQVQK